MSKLEGLPNVRVLQLDITIAADIQAAVAVVSEETGGSLTYLINCAARNHFMPLLDENIDDAKKIHDTNVWGPLAVTQAFSPLLIQAKGTVVFITSLAGHLNVPYQGKSFQMLLLASLIPRRNGVVYFILYVLRCFFRSRLIWVLGTYAASKMSEEILAETMRLELAPFNVKVLSVVSGGLKTMGQTHFDDWRLPENSLYAQVEATIRDRARGQEGAPRMEAAEYAHRVVSEILKGRTGKFWYGASAGATKFGTQFLPTSLMVRENAPFRSLHPLRKLLLTLH